MFWRAINRNKIENKDNNNYISNRIKAPKSLNSKIYNKENKNNVIKLTRKKYGDKENIRDNNEKNFVGNDNNKI